ncbi:Uncharacterised protein [Mesomycoplasma conjunctivae]|nr:hypothetical protein [Mesomycoplasma conjunctivae]VEU66079.1 Uncharacterised protein [Mesomycoplasma conjunctivae]
MSDKDFFDRLMDWVDETIERKIKTSKRVKHIDISDTSSKSSFTYICVISSGKKTKKENVKKRKKD